MMTLGPKVFIAKERITHTVLDTPITLAHAGDRLTVVRKSYIGYEVFHPSYPDETFTVLPEQVELP